MLVVQGCVLARGVLHAFQGLGVGVGRSVPGSGYIMVAMLKRRRCAARLYVVLSA